MLQRLNRSEVFLLVVFIAGLLFGIAIGIIMGTAMYCPVPAKFDPTPLFETFVVQLFV